MIRSLYIFRASIIASAGHARGLFVGCCPGRLGAEKTRGFCYHGR